MLPPGFGPADINPVTSPALIIEKRKWDGSVSARWTAQFHRDGAQMIWRTPAGTRRLHPRRGETEVTEHLEVSATCGAGWITTAVLDREGRLIRYEVDATAGGEAERDGLLAFIDLDLDLEIEEDTPIVTDLLEFAERRGEMGYPPGLLSAAVRALEDARLRYQRREWPFDGSLLGPTAG